MFSLYPVHRRTSAHLLKTFERNLDDLFRWQKSHLESSWLTPRTEEFETEDAYELRIDAPGLSEDDINITLENKILKIVGNRQHSVPENYKVLRQERASVDFSYQHQLTEEIDSLQVSAKLNDGILSIHLPKQEQVKPRLIKVTTNA